MIGCLSARMGLASSVRAACQVEVPQTLLLVDFQFSVRAVCQVVGGDILVRLGNLTRGGPDGQQIFFGVWSNICGKPYNCL